MNMDYKAKGSNIRHGFVRAMRRACVFVSCAIFFFSCLSAGTETVSAQSSMTGGGYTLNGGFSVFDSLASGAGYTLRSTGDGAIIDASGGGYVFGPTPFATMTQGAGGSAGGGGSTPSGISGGSYTGGYVYRAPIDGYPDGYPMFDTAISNGGMQWIDRGEGVDTDFDGIPDSYGPASSGSALRDRTRGTGERYGGGTSPDAETSLVKTYHHDIGMTKVVLMMLFGFCALFSRIIRTKTGAEYRISRIPGAILVDYAVLLHKGDPHDALGEVPIRDLKSEEALLVEASTHDRSAPSALALFDLLVVPLLAVFSIMWMSSISSILASIFGIVIVWRLWIGKKLLSS